MKKIVYLIILFSFFYSCKSKSKMVEKSPKENYEYLVKFQKANELSEVLAKAAAENKWIYVDFGAKWCVPCQIMKRDVYKSQEIADFFNKNFITYLVDIEKDEGPDLKIIFNVNSYPTLLFIDSKGRETLRKEGGLSASTLLKYGNEALVKKTMNN
jgi:thiol:disulfide interchange protein